MKYNFEDTELFFLSDFIAAVVLALFILDCRSQDQQRNALEIFSQFWWFTLWAKIEI